MRILPRSYGETQNSPVVDYCTWLLYIGAAATTVSKVWVEMHLRLFHACTSMWSCICALQGICTWPRQQNCKALEDNSLNWSKNDISNFITAEDGLAMRNVLVALNFWSHGQKSWILCPGGHAWNPATESKLNYSELTYLETLYSSDSGRRRRLIHAAASRWAFRMSRSVLACPATFGDVV